MGATFYTLELDQVGKRNLWKLALHTDNELVDTCADDGVAIQDALKEITSQSSVPNIFINKQHIGGNSDLQAKQSQLHSLLKEAGAV